MLISRPVRSVIYAIFLSHNMDHTQDTDLSFKMTVGLLSQNQWVRSQTIAIVVLMQTWDAGIKGNQANPEISTTDDTT